MLSELHPHDGYYGDWTQFNQTSCGTNFLAGVAIKYDDPDFADLDHWGATDLKMFCENGSELHTGEHAR